MSGLRLWPWLAGTLAVHAVLLTATVPRAIPAVIPVRVTTEVSFSVPRPAPLARPEPVRQTADPVSLADTASSVPVETSAPPGDPTVVGRYLAGLRQAVADNKSYPYAARTRRQEGTVLLAFRLDGRGWLADEPQVVQSSGYPRLDAAAVEAVRTSSPFVPPPEAARPWEFRVPVEFVVR